MIVKPKLFVQLGIITMGYCGISHYSFAVQQHSTALTSQKASQSNKDQVGTIDSEDHSVQPIVDAISFSGNDKVSSARLMQLIPLKIGSGVDENKLMQSMIKIAEFYKKNRIKVTITPSIGQMNHQHTTVQFKIHESY